LSSNLRFFDFFIKIKGYKIIFINKMTGLLYSLIGVSIVSLISLVGIVSLLVRDKILQQLLIFLVAFAAGSLIGGAFFHLLPEAVEAASDTNAAFVLVVAGFLLFFILERVLRWHHCHDSECETHQHLGWLNLFGDGLHNLLDGMIIFSAFAVGPALGWPIVVSIILHEIPQELSDFGVLVYSGFSRVRALIYNLLSGLLSVAGVLLAWLLAGSYQNFNQFLVALAAGGFIYIAASDLIPELHKERKLTNSLWSFGLVVAALVFMWAIKAFFG